MSLRETNTRNTRSVLNPDILYDIHTFTCVLVKTEHSYIIQCSKTL